MFRHLCAASSVVDADGLRHTICNTLSDFGWLRGRFVRDGHTAVLSDYSFALASRRCATSSAEKGLLVDRGARKSIRALQLGLSLILGEKDILTEPEGVLAGSLVQLALSSVGCRDAGLDSSLFYRLACSVENEVHGSWFKSIRGCSRVQDQPGPEGALSQAFVSSSGGRVLSFAALGDEAHFISGSADWVVRVHESDFLGACLELKGHTDQVNCVAVAEKNGIDRSFLIFSGSNDGTVRSWIVDIHHVKGAIEKSGVLVGDCGSWVKCLAVTKGGDLVAAGCRTGFVFIWKRQAEDADTLFELITSFSCTAEETESGWVKSVAVSQSGHLVVAGEEKGGIAFWSSGEGGMEGIVDRHSASDGSSAKLWHVLLSEMESRVCFVFVYRPGCEVWDIISRRRLSTRVALPTSTGEVFTSPAFGAREEECAEGRGSHDLLIAVNGSMHGADRNQNIRSSISLHATHDDFTVLSTYLWAADFRLAATPCSVCCTSFGGDKRILVGSDDGCVRMLDAGVPFASDGAESYEEGVRSLMNASSSTSGAEDLGDVITVAVMAGAGLVIAVHDDERTSLWNAESGEFIRVLEDEGGSRLARCIDISANESLVVSGRGNGVVLIWDGLMCECRFALPGHSKPVDCVTISTDAKRIVTFDSGGEVRFWDAESGGAALWTIETGLQIKCDSRGAISVDGGIFLCAGRDGEWKWEGKIIDVWKWKSRFAI